MELKRITDIRQGNGYVLFRAENPATRTRHLVKEVCIPDEDGYFARRLRSEFSQMARLEHPHLLRPAGIVNNDRLLVYEDAQCSLAQYLARKGKLPPVLAVNLLQQVADALKLMHASRIGHGNLGATNVFVGPQGEIKLGDFLGFSLGGAEPIPDPDPLPRYQAPEFNDSAFGEPCPSSDLYGLGYLILEALTATGFPGLFGPGEQGDNLAWHLDPTKKLEHWRSSLFQAPEGLLDLLEGMIQKGIHQRAFRSAQELLDQLGRLRIASNQLFPPFQEENGQAAGRILPTAPRLLILKPSDRPKGPPLFLLPGKPAILGSVSGCDLVVQDRGVASRHAMLHAEADGAWRLYDLRGRAPCEINGSREPVQPVDDGATLRVGQLTLRAEMGERQDPSRKLCGVQTFYQLHKGKNGRSFLGTWEKKGKSAVLRVFPSAFGEDEAWIRRLLGDSSSINRCSTRSITGLFEAGKRTLPDRTLWYLIHEYCQWGSLRDRLMREESTGPVDLLGIAARACRALRAVHRVGVVHGNLHPGCLLFDQMRRVKVLFCPLPLDGRIVFRSEGGKFALLPSHLRYRAPELFGSPLPGSPATDLYALAACLLEAASGSPPFAGAMSADSVLAEKNRPDRILGKLPSSYPASAEGFFRKALHPDPIARFLEPAPFLVELRKAICPDWKPDSGKKKRRRRK